MDQNNNSPNNSLYALLANPAANASFYVHDLQQLVNENPQSGILQALLALASEEKNLKLASVYYNPRLLYKLINNPASFNVVNKACIYIQPGLEQQPKHVYYNEPGSQDHPDQTAFAKPSTPEAEPVVNQFHELTSLEDTDITEHRLDEQIAADNEPSGQFSEAITEEKTEEVQFHPGLENIILTGESIGLPQDKEMGQLGSTLKPENDPFITDSANKYLDNSISNQHELTKELVNYETDDINSDLNKKTEKPQDYPALQTTDGTIPGTELPAKDTYSGAGQVNINNDDQQQAPEPIKCEGEIKHPEPQEIIVIDHLTNELKKDLKSHDIEDDVYDEIIGIEFIHLNNIPSVKHEKQELPNIKNDEENRLIIENIAATDFFLFDDTFNIDEQPGSGSSGPAPVETAVVEDLVPDVIEIPQPVIKEHEAGQAELNNANEETQDVSRYNDDKMPYTFMWWLDRTRKEHAGVLQPYAEKKEPDVQAAKPSEDVLQQQYYTNIFHITSVEELSKIEPAHQFSFGVKNRPQQIIEKFIKEEPQIKPQSGDKIDNENKAKKSAEDRDEIITETLAAIYAEQMLFHKAIASYKKLITKFPEKSSYFADKIQQLEKKIN